MSVKPVCDTNQLKIAGTYLNQANADTQCLQLEPINLEGEDTLEVQQFQLQRILQPTCQAQEMAKSLVMRLRKKTTKGWTKSKKSERLNATNKVNQNQQAVALVEERQRHRVLGAVELCTRKEEFLQNSLRKSGQNQQVATQGVHQTGQALT